LLQAFSGGTIFGERHGIGRPTILALHGWARTRSDFTPTLTGLDAVALDLPGFGSSPEPAEPLGAAGYADLVAPVLDELAPPVVVVGHSFGGRVAVKLAVAHPERIGALILTGVPLVRLPSRDAPSPALRYRAARWLHGRGLLSDAAMERRRRRHGSEDYRAARGVMRDVLVTVVNESYEDDLPLVRCRMDLVWGGRDEVVPVAVMEAAAALATAAPEVATEVVAAAGHLLPLQSPERLAMAIRRSQSWLKR
jgi:pimeloyl-ACP methyl ester carboxylesterase